MQISDKHTVDWHIIGSTMPQDKTLLAQKQGFLDIYLLLYKSRPTFSQFIQQSIPSSCIIAAFYSQAHPS
jgi:hypothetical protein